MRDAQASPAATMILALGALAALVAMAGCLGAESTADPAADPAEATGSKVGAADGDVDRRIVVDIEAVQCPEGYDNEQDDDICLAYNGQIPGPTWVFEKDQRVQIELRHRVAESLAALDADVNETVAERLAQGRYSMHRHGLSLDPCSDGVAKIEGTEICDSTVGPGETVTYTFNTSFPGTWHYHDHGLAFNGETIHDGFLGPEAEARGLWGSFKVLEEGETTENVFDLHVLDNGINGGMGLNETVAEGERFDLLVSGLGMRPALETVWLTGPDGETVDEAVVGPGISRGLTVEDAEPGTYTWHAERFVTRDPEPWATYQGTIEVDGSGSTGPSTDSDAHAHEHDHEQSPVPPAFRSVEDDTRVRPPDWEQADRRFVIDFVYNTADKRSTANEKTGGPPGGLPLLEAYAGETLAFEVITGEPFPHVFHLHGHPWEHPETGEMIDAEPLPMGDSHSFTVTAGLGEGHTGDWFYHCHIGVDVGPMWSVLRVYEHSMAVQGPLEDLRVTVEDADGNPIEGATLTARWNPDAPADPTLATADEGREIPVTVDEVAPGEYEVEADVPEGVAGELVVESEHEDGDSLVRLAVDADGSYELNRDVGVDRGDDSAANEENQDDGGRGHPSGFPGEPTDDPRTDGW